ncbi:MAG: aspartate/glutamate racemase family protein [Patescibacteria group bacterium]
MGVLGGMGPGATASFYTRLIRLSREKFGASANNDYPHILIYNLPVPDLIADKAREKEAYSMMVSAIKDLERAGVDFIVIPCNTVHLYLERLRCTAKVPILNLIELVAEEVAASEVGKIGILATRTALKAKLYQGELEKRGIPYFMPTEEGTEALVQAELMEISGESKKRARLKVLKVIMEMVKRGADGAILGCTELPLLVGNKDTPLQIFDTLEILADKTLEFAYEENNYG